MAENSLQLTNNRRQAMPQFIEATSRAIKERLSMSHRNRQFIEMGSICLLKGVADC